MGIRRKGREIALQTLYSLDLLSENGEDIDIGESIKKLEEIALEEEINTTGKIFRFAEQILNNLVDNLEIVDEKIKKHSLNWSFEKIASLDKNIMRIATGEMLFSDVAHPVIMDEAIEIAKKYCSESSGKFINGILNAISQEIKSGEKG
ncbi:MAG: transcription antitermination factor NusB [Candidatus Cloacimonadota bacterium]|nr:MAG: transcription antitermination factor NusB [Candidatus Cloacimonadota bacterium]